MSQLRFGVLALQDQPWDREIERSRWVEMMGFDTYWVADHFVDFTRPSAPWFEAWTLLAGLATLTRSIRIGTLVTSMAWRNPAFLARQALTVDHLSAGRLELGLGAGVRGDLDTTYAMTGIEDWPPGERVDRFQEGVELIDQLLRHRVTTFRGRYYQTKDSTLNPPPVQQPRPPITVAAHQPRMLGIAARYADAWNTYGTSGHPSEEVFEEISEQSRLLDTHCERLGRDPSTLRRSLLIFGDDRSQCAQDARAFRRLVYRYLAIGITEFIVFYPSRRSHLETLEEIAREVIPEFTPP